MALSFFAPIIQSENPTQTIARDFPYIEAVNSVQEETPKEEISILATLYLSQNDLSLPTEPILEQEIGVSASFETPPTQKFYSCINFIKEYYIEFKDKQLYYPKYLWKHYSDFGLEKIDIPVVGALVITLDNPYYGHVGIVEVVNENSFSMIEENLKPGQITTRSLDFDDGIIVGFLK